MGDAATKTGKRAHFRELVDNQYRLWEYGKWVEAHSQAILNALRRAQIGLPVGLVSSFERAVDAAPKELKG